MFSITSNIQSTLQSSAVLNPTIPSLYIASISLHWPSETLLLITGAHPPSPKDSFSVA